MELRPLTPSDTTAWSQLIAAAFSRTPDEAAAVWHWLQANHDLVAWGAWDGARLAAQYSCLFRSLYLPATQSTHQVGISTNMAVHPDYRGQGLVKQVAEPVYALLRQRGVLAGVGFSNAEGVKVDQRSQGYGYRVVGALSSHLIWLRLHPFIEVKALANTPAKPSIPMSGMQLTPTLPFTIEAVTTDHCSKISFHNGLNTLQHRFAAHPFRRYRFWVYRAANGAARGVVVDRPTTWMGVAGSSLLAAYGQELPEVMRTWTKAVRAQGTHFVRVLATPHAEALQALGQLGCSFKLRPRQPHFLTVKPLQPNCPTSLFDLSQWDCLGGEVL